MSLPEKYDTRPRADRYNRAVFRYLELRLGPDAARAGLARLEADQAARGIGPRMRLPREGDVMPGFPVINLSPDARAMAVEARAFPWFSNVAQPLAGEADVKPVQNWKQAQVRLLGRAWENVTIDLMNALTSAVAARSREVYDEMWNEVVYTFDRILPDGFFDEVGRKLQVSDDVRANVLAEVRLIVCWACLETHWSSFVHIERRVFLGLYRWLQQGRLPCGVTRRPTLKFVVF